MILRKPVQGFVFLILSIGISFGQHCLANSPNCGDLRLNTAPDSVVATAESNFAHYALSLYSHLGDTSMNYQAFEQGLIGYHNLMKEEKIERQNTLTIIDFSKPSNQDRLYIIDLCSRKILYKSIVSHGVKSGRLYAQHFSNEANSHKSSLGFYVTSTTYTGKYDLALRLNGMEHSNSHARSRGVVMHAANYATYEFLKQNGGTLGRSYGCPALPFKNFDQVVEWIKEGTCLYIYYPSSSYQRYSRYLNQKKYLEDFMYG